jgi:hypothetical protein
MMPMGDSKNKGQPNPNMLCHYVQHNFKTDCKYQDVQHTFVKGLYKHVHPNSPVQPNMDMNITLATVFNSS